MADAVAWQRYADETRPLTVKQRVQEASVAHPDCVEATSETREATVTRFDGDRDHSRADLVDDSVPATAVGKTSRQEWNEHYSIVTKPESQQSRATTHRMRLATVNRRFR